MFKNYRPITYYCYFQNIIKIIENDSEDLLTLNFLTRRDHKGSHDKILLTFTSMQILVSFNFLNGRTCSNVTFAEVAIKHKSGVK